MDFATNWKLMGTQGRIDAIRAVWFSGCSTREIAANFKGATRNAIIGIYQRHGDCLADKPLRSKIAVAAELKSKKRAPVTFLFADKVASRPLPKPKTVATVEHHLCGKPMMMLEPKECRFSVNNAGGDELHLFCGVPTDRVYCDHHLLRAYQPKEARP